MTSRSLRQITPEMTSSSAHLFGPAPVTTRNLARRLGPSRPVPNAGTNPSAGVSIDYWLAQAPAGEATLTILDGAGNEIKQFSSATRGREGLPAAVGVNRFLWDMRYPDVPAAPREDELTSFEATSPAAPVAAPGSYTVRLTVDGQAYEQPFQIRKDPQVAATDADLQAQFELSMNIRQRASDIVDALNRIHDAQRQLAGSTADAAQVASAREQLRAIEGQLQRLANPDNPMDTQPKGLYNQLGSLSRNVLSADARPTQSEVAVFDTLSARVDVQLQQLNELLSNTLPGLGGS